MCGVCSGPGVTAPPPPPKSVTTGTGTGSNTYAQETGDELMCLVFGQTTRGRAECGKQWQSCGLARCAVQQEELPEAQRAARRGRSPSSGCIEAGATLTDKLGSPAGQLQASTARNNQFSDACCPLSRSGSALFRLRRV